MADENGGEGENPFSEFTTHEVDGKSTSTSEGSKQTEATDDGRSDTQEAGQEGAEETSDELDGAELPGEADGEDTDADAGGRDDDEGEDDNSEDQADGEAGDDGDDRGDEGGDGEDGKPKKKSVRERIGEVTKARRVAERRADAAEARATAQDERIAALEKRLTGDDEGGSEENSDQGSALTAPNPDNFDYGEMDPGYIEALTDYRVDLRMEKDKTTQEETRQAEAEQQEAVELQTAMDDTIAVGVEAYDDFEDVVVKAVDDGRLPLSPAMAFMGVNSPVGHHVLHQIANDLPLAKKLVAMPAHEQIAEFGRLSAQYTDEGGTKPKPNKTPQATPPPSGRKGAKGPKKTNPSTSNFADFEKSANADLAKQPKDF